MWKRGGWGNDDMFNTLSDPHTGVGMTSYHANTEPLYPPLHYTLCVRKNNECMTHYVASECEKSIYTIKLAPSMERVKTSSCCCAGHCQVLEVACLCLEHNGVHCKVGLKLSDVVQRFFALVLSL